MAYRKVWMTAASRGAALLCLAVALFMVFEPRHAEEPSGPANPLVKSANTVLVNACKLTTTSELRDKNGNVMASESHVTPVDCDTRKPIGVPGMSGHGTAGNLAAHAAVNGAEALVLTLF